MGLAQTAAQVWDGLRIAARLIRPRRRQRVIDTVAGLEEFVRTRAAFVSQTSLNGYLKARMGTKFTMLYTDAVFSTEIARASRRIFLAAASDLAVFAAATAGGGNDVEASDMVALARHCFERAVQQALVDDHAGAGHVSDEEAMRKKAVADFARRAKAVDWAVAATGEKAFVLSPRALLEAAPVSDEFKELDEEIAVNSVRFRWREVREQLRANLRAEAVWSDFAAG